MELNEYELRIYNIGLLEVQKMELNKTKNDIYSLKLKLTESLNEPMDIREFETLVGELVKKMKLKNKLVYKIENLE